MFLGPQKGKIAYSKHNSALPFWSGRIHRLETNMRVLLSALMLIFSRTIFFPAETFIDSIKKVVIKFELWVAKCTKLHRLIIPCATTNLLDSWRCAYKVSRPGLKKCHINAIYIPPLQYFARIVNSTWVCLCIKVYRHPQEEFQQAPAFA